MCPYLTPPPHTHTPLIHGKQTPTGFLGPHARPTAAENPNKRQKGGAGVLHGTALETVGSCH